MDGKIILEEHLSTELNNKFWDSDGEDKRNGQVYADDVSRRLLDPGVCLAEMDRARIDHCVLSLTSRACKDEDFGTAAEQLRISERKVQSGRVIAASLDRRCLNGSRCLAQGVLLLTWNVPRNTVKLTHR